MVDSRFSRRSFVNTSAGIGLSGFGLASCTPSTHKIDKLPDEPDKQLHAMVKMMGTTSEDRVVWKTKGKIFAIMPDDVVMLYGMRGSESTWWRRVNENTYVRFNSTMSFFTDPENDEIIDEFVSPINEVSITLEPSFIRHKEGEWFTPMGSYYGSMKKAFPDKYKDKPLNLDWVLDGDVIRRQEGDNFPPILPQPSIEYASMFARASEVFDPEIDRAEGVAAGWNIMSASRPPFNKMGIGEGCVNWHFDAVKIDNVDQLDDDYLDKARAFSDRFDVSPELDEGPSFFERILKLRGMVP